MDLLKGKDLENLLKKNQTLASYQKREFERNAKGIYLYAHSSNIKNIVL